MQRFNDIMQFPTCVLQRKPKPYIQNLLSSYRSKHQQLCCTNYSSMLSVITRIMSSSLGLVLNKAGNTAVHKRKEREDVMDEKLREAINDDLNDIQTNIEGLAQKDLLASYSFLKEGIVTLSLALDEAKDEPISKNEANADQDGGGQTNETTTGNKSDSEATQLSTAIQKLKNTSNSRLVAAKQSFEAAGAKAIPSGGFCNKALSLPERIMATKLRVVSKILECLQETKVASVACMLFLEELHNLPAIGETFSTYLKGGIKSWVYKDSRLENVKSVLCLNFAVSEFVAKFSGELPNISNWPRIHLPTRGKTIHPLVIDSEVVKEIFGKKQFQLPENQINSDGVFLENCCINSKEELLMSNLTHVEIVPRSGEEKSLCKLPTKKRGHLAIDRRDSVFVITYSTYGPPSKLNPIDAILAHLCLAACRQCTRTVEYFLRVFDSSGNKKHECKLDFLESVTLDTLNCVVNNDIFIHKDTESFVYICDFKGNFKSRLSFEENSSYRSGRDFISMECVTDDDGIVMRTRKNVLVYTKEGMLTRTIKVKHYIEAVTYNYVTSKIEILVKKKSPFKKSMRYYIYSYSESNEVERLYVPVKCSPTLGRRIRFCQHPAGCAALVIENNAAEEHSIIFM